MDYEGSVGVAITVRIGPLRDTAGAPYVGALAYTDFLIGKNATAAGALDATATATHEAGGTFRVALTASDISEVGNLTLILNKASYDAKPVVIVVRPTNVYDSLVAGTDNLKTNIHTKQLVVMMDALSLRNRFSTLMPIAGPLDIAKYGADGVLHPTAVEHFDGSGFARRVLFTPYPTPYEFICILRSTDGGTTWVDTGITNPVVPLGGGGSWNESYCADPAWLRLGGRWLLFFAGYSSTSGRAAIGLYANNDGLTIHAGLAYSAYNGTAVNGLAQPQILSGNDANGKEWERSSGGDSLTVYPAPIAVDDTIYLFYGDSASGNNRGHLGLATFLWDDVTSSISSFARHGTNPVFFPLADAECKSGGGHWDICYNPADGLYYMLGVRVRDGRFRSWADRSHEEDYVLCLWTNSDIAADPTAWTYHGVVLRPSTERDDWASKFIYKGGFVRTPEGELVLQNGRPEVMYSAFSLATGHASFGTALGVGQATDYAEAIADTTLTRDMARCEADAANVSLCTLTLAATNKSNTTSNPGYNTVFRTDGVTEHCQIPLATDENADPIVGVG